MAIGRGKKDGGTRLGRGWTVLLAVAGLIAAAAAPVWAQAVQVTLLHVNDTHSHLTPWGPKDAGLEGTLGGIAKAAYLVAAERAADPNAIFVHAGDFMDGDFFFNDHLGVPELRLLKDIGLDALVPGNHEFRLGPSVLSDILAAAWPEGPAAGVPLLGANVDPAGHGLGAWIVPSLIKDVNGVKVGLFGVTIHKNALLNPAPVVIRKITGPLVQQAVDALRDRGAQVVIGVSHAGLDVMRAIPPLVSGLDVIVNGHDNAVLEQPEAIGRADGGTTVIVSAGDRYRWVGRLRLSVSGGQVAVSDYALLGADAATPPRASVRATVETLKAGIVLRYGDVYHRALAWAEDDIALDGSRSPAGRDTALGNLLADAYRAWTGTDVAIEPFAYVGDALPEGPVVGADLFRAMSYGSPSPWKLVTFGTTGEALRHALDTTLTLGGDFFPQVSGMRFSYDSEAEELYGDAFGTKRLILADTVHVGGQRLLDDRVYSVTVTEGVYQALRYMLMVPMQDIRKWPDMAFEAVRDLVARRGVLGLATSNRIRDVAAFPRIRKTGPVAAPPRRAPGDAPAGKD
jgi:2',3'-cyclic-nucleotide 2'-phosphodiesterase (5'-nucleotidase family)